MVQEGGWPLAPWGVRTGLAGLMALQPWVLPASVLTCSLGGERWRPMARRRWRFP